MSDLLSIGRAGVTAYRSALAVVADNVTNAETPGYARRSVSLQESSVSFGASPYFKATTTFGGVNAVGTQRAWDDFKAADARLSSGDAARADARVRWLSTTEAALDDSENGIGTRLTSVFSAADALAADPNGDLPRRQMLLALDDAAGTIRTSADALARTADGIAGEAGLTVDSINADLVSLAKLNAALNRAGNGTSAFVQLADQRDKLLDGLAAKIGIDVAIEPSGMAIVTLAGTAGATLIGGIDPSRVGLVRAADGRLSLTLADAQGTTPIFPSAGTLAGLIEVASTVTDRRAQLDTIAADFTAALNGWQAQGRDPNGQPGAPLLSISGGAATLALATNDPAAIAAAAPGGAANGNLLALAPLRGNNGAEKQWAALVAGHSQVVASAKSEATAASARGDAAFAARDDVSGIDLDQEAANLLRFQQAYDGSAKIIQVARETLQTILNLF
jgi:flagellar hook-associated protein 1 FlgK